MKVRFSRAEWYPVYSESFLGHGYDAEIDEDLWKRYLEAREKFDDLLTEVGEILDASL